MVNKQEDKKIQNLEVFKNEEFGSVRALTINNEPWFVGKNVAEVLGYTNPSKALSDHVEEEDKLNNETLSSLGQRGGWLINESGLYSLILSSKLESAKKFKRWVTSEVLPTLRKTGKYSINEMDSKELLARAVIESQRLLEEKDKQIEELKPKALFADAISASEGDVNVGTLAKLLRQNGIDIGRNKLFEWLRDNGYLMKGGNEYNQPTQQYSKSGLFRIKEAPLNLKDGRTEKALTTMVTSKGQKYFINKFLKLNDKGEQ